LQANEQDIKVSIKQTQTQPQYSMPHGRRRVVTPLTRLKHSKFSVKRLEAMPTYSRSADRWHQMTCHPRNCNLLAGFAGVKLNSLAAVVPAVFLKRPCGGLISWCQPAVCRCHLPELESALSSAATWATVQLQLQKNSGKTATFQFQCFPVYAGHIIAERRRCNIIKSNQIKYFSVQDIKV